MDVPDKLPTILQLVHQLKVGSAIMVIWSPIATGWVKAWKSPDGSIWSQVKIDDGK